VAKTFLQLAAHLSQECGVSTVGPTTVVSQVGQYKELVDWIAQADEEVQQERNDWRFMVGNFSIDTVAGTSGYLPAAFVTPVTNWRDVRENTVNIYSGTTANQSRLRRVDYQTWYDLYNTGAQTNSRPIVYTIGNDMSMVLGPLPDAVYRVSGEYQKSVSTLAADSDTPIYPSEFHMLPVYLAMTKYGRQYAASEVYSEGNRLYMKMMARMRRTQAQEVSLGGPLA
jgi:hypothetical protein